MHEVLFIVYPGFELLDTVGPSAVFNSANRALGLHGKPAFYEIGLVSTAGGVVKSSSGIAVETMPIADLRKRQTRTILVVGAEREHVRPMMGDPALRASLPALAMNAELFTWWMGGYGHRQV
jgi:transcriptional regulator GlxA family with amidase domain